MALAGMAQLVGVPFCGPKCCRLDSWAEQVPTVGVWSMVRVHARGQLIDVSLSTSLSLPSSLSRSSERMSSSKHLKKLFTDGRQDQKPLAALHRPDCCRLYVNCASPSRGWGRRSGELLGPVPLSLNDPIPVSRWRVLTAPLREEQVWGGFLKSI